MRVGVVVGVARRSRVIPLLPPPPQHPPSGPRHSLPSSTLSTSPLALQTPNTLARSLPLKGTPSDDDDTISLA